MTLSAVGRPIVPREHGVWAVLYGSFLVGAGVAGRVTVPVVLFLVGITAAAFANGCLAVLARRAIGLAQEERRRHALAWLLIYGAVAVAALGPLLFVFRMAFLLPFGVGAAIVLVLRAFLIRGRDDRTLVGELVGAAGLTMVGAASHAVAVGEVRPIGAALWVLLFLFFASGVFYVRMRIHGMMAQRKGIASETDAVFWPCLLYHALLVVLVLVMFLLHFVPWPVLLAFVPALWRAAAGFHHEKARLDVRRLGWSEVAMASTFVLLLIAAFRLTTLGG